MKEYRKVIGKYENDKIKKPKVLVLMGLPGSYIVATEKSYVGDLVRIAGGINVYGDGKGRDFIHVSTEDMLSKKPDFILRASHGLPDEVKEMFAKEFKSNDIWKHFSAVKNGNVYDLSNISSKMSGDFTYKEG